MPYEDKEWLRIANLIDAGQESAKRWGGLCAGGGIGENTELTVPA